MKHIFLDTNVLIDLLANREPFAAHAAGLFSLADKGKLKIHVSAISFNNIYYVIRKVEKHKKAIQLLAELESLVEISRVGERIIRNAMNSDFNDFEDALQYQCCLENGQIECIVSRNLKDFKNSQLPVFTPETVFKQLKNHD